MPSTLKNIGYSIISLALMIEIGTLDTWFIDFGQFSPFAVTLLRMAFLALFFYFVLKATGGGRK